MERIYISLAWMLAAVALTACGGSTPNTAANTTAANTQQFDLEATIVAYAATLVAEEALLQQILDPNDSLDDAESRQYWQLLQERKTHADDLQAMLEADPTWMESICGWYEAKLSDPWLEVIRLRRQVFERDGDTPGWPEHWRVLVEPAGSQEAVQQFSRSMGDHPAEPTNLHIMCVKFGHIEEE